MCTYIGGGVYLCLKGYHVVASREADPRPPRRPPWRVCGPVDIAAAALGGYDLASAVGAPCKVPVPCIAWGPGDAGAVLGEEGCSACLSRGSQALSCMPSEEYLGLLALAASLSYRGAAFRAAVFSGERSAVAPFQGLADLIRSLGRLLGNARWAAVSIKGLRGGGASVAILVSTSEEDAFRAAEEAAERYRRSRAYIVL